ncbi:MAG: HPP family protein [Sulfuricella sp.]|nr:HPP family protein [Sulfuricella sp.]
MLGQRLFAYLFPRQTTVTHRERLISGFGGVGAILATTWLTHIFIGQVTAPYMLAAMGASTVLLLGAPHSPFSQPWSFIGGHLVSATIGVFCAMELHNVYLSAGLAVGLSILAMYYLRCLHPPGGATALLAVIGDQRIHSMGYHFIVMPVLINVVILMGVTLLINRLVLRRHYPFNPSFAGNAAGHGNEPHLRPGLSKDDLHAALKEMNSFIDVTEEDLERIFSLATLHTYRRQVGDLRLKDIMTRDVVTIKPGASLDEVWKLLRQHRIRGVPVVDDAQHLVGVLTIADFLKVTDWRMCHSMRARIRLMFSRHPAYSAVRIMTAPVTVASEDMHLTEAFRIFAESGINHLPVVSGHGKLVGILTRLDLLASVYGGTVAASAT